jgi:hypothetical protein
MMALEPDVLLPDQFGWGVSPQGERRLMLAVLADAVDCYRTGRRARDPARRLLFAETRAWVESTDRRAVFAFESICDTLDIDPDYVRRRLRQERAPGPGRPTMRNRTAGGVARRTASPVEAMRA